jgi:hypothetical protein
VFLEAASVSQTDKISNQQEVVSAGKTLAPPPAHSSIAANSSTNFFEESNLRSTPATANQTSFQVHLYELVL